MEVSFNFVHHFIKLFLDFMFIIIPILFRKVDFQFLFEEFPLFIDSNLPLDFFEARIILDFTKLRLNLNFIEVKDFVHLID